MRMETSSQRLVNKNGLKQLIRLHQRIIGLKFSLSRVYDWCKDESINLLVAPEILGNVIFTFHNHHSVMFVAIYSFKVHPGKDDQFINAWKELTELILAFEDSLGSRLHKENEDTYIAYAQWKSREQWENAGDNLPESSAPIRAEMKAACSEIETIHELEMTEDLLVPNPK